VPPHNGVGNAGLVASYTRSTEREYQGHNNAHAMATPFRQETPPPSPADRMLATMSSFRLPFFTWPPELGTVGQHPVPDASHLSGGRDNRLLRPDPLGQPGYPGFQGRPFCDAV
jgi:hypothetical protein